MGCKVACKSYQPWGLKGSWKWQVAALGEIYAGGVLHKTDTYSLIY